ncbi:MAG TPA: ABC transporter permease [Ktedonobacterales bacterium]|nr:ABC transporter permease [Ktedonobacterales bacterium]
MTAPTVSPPQRATAGVLRWLTDAGRALAAPAGSVIFAFVVGGVLVAVTGGNPITAYQGLACGGVGLFCANGETPALQISTTIVFATPLILTGLSVAIAFRSGLFNIGAEGQLIMGAIACTVVGVRFADAPAWVLLPLVLIAGTLAGALWGGIVGVLKAVTGAHEVVTTIMLNYVAQWFLRFLIIGGPLQLPNGFSTSSPIGTGADLPTFLPQSHTVTLFGLPEAVYRAHTGLIVSLAAAAFYAFLLKRTALGYEIRAVGQSHRAARYAGVSVRRTIIVSMLIAGAFAGLAGAVQVAGIDHNLTDKYFTDTTGFDAIAVALLGQGAALGIVISAFLFGALHAGGSVMQADAGVSGNLVLVLQALILFSIAANFLMTIKFRLPGLGRAPDSPADVATTAGPPGEEPNPALVDSQNTA